MMRRSWRNKWKATLFLIAIILALIVVGCSGQEASQSNDDPVNTDEQTETETNGENGESTEAEYPDTLSYWVAMNAQAATTQASYNEIGVYQEIEKLTGTQVEFEHPSGEGDQVTEQLNLMLASGELPDVIETNWLNVPRGPDNAINEGTIIRLNELIEEHAPNLRSYLDENPDVETMLTSNEGNIYMFPFIREDELLMTSAGPVVRQDWLDKVEMDVPTTLDDWEEVLTAFRDNDLNENNEDDEIPLLLRLNFFKITDAFVGAWGISSEFYHENGEVKYGPIEPEFKEFLTMMNRWYENGLIDPDFAAIDNSLEDAKVTGNQVGSLLRNVGGGIGRYMGLMEDDPDFQLVGVPYPTLNEGEVAPLGHQDPPITGTGAAITGTAENPEEIVKWLDLAYGEEGHILFNFGVEGESYEMIDGYPTYTDYIINNPDGLPPAETIPQFARASMEGPFIQDVRYFEQYMELPEQLEASETWSEPENNKKMPPVTMTADESQTYSSVMSDVETYWEEMVVRFIMGDSPLDDFDQFVETLKSMGIEEAISIQQEAFDRYQER